MYEDRNGTDIYYYYDSYGVPTAIRYYKADGTTYRFVLATNQQGDVIGLYNASGNLVVKYEYDAWGNIISETNATGGTPTSLAQKWSDINPFRYRGYYYDSETGLYYLNSRYYDSETGRFINSDVLLDTSDILGFNPFAYCGNNPVSREDDYGEFWDVVFDIASIAYSAYQAIKNPSSSNLLGLAVDVVCAVVPFVSGGGIAVRAAGKVDDVYDAAKVTTKADDVYDSVKACDNLNGATKSVPNPYGKKGGPAHRAEILNQTSKYAPEQVNFEVKIDTPGGYKPYRYADFSVTENGKTWYGNVGKRLKSGDPCARERYALSDIRSTGVEIKFFPYN